VSPCADAALATPDSMKKGIKKATAQAVAKQDVHLKEQQNVSTTEQHTGRNKHSSMNKGSVQRLD
jgi:hypothetical protein